MIKPIPEFNDYFIDSDGNVYSVKSGILKRLRPHKDTKGRYLMIRLIRNDGIRKSLLVHRIVAEAFVPNPLNLPEINHIDNNPANPVANNLEWCTHKENLHLSYQTMSPARNCNSCDLYVDGKWICKYKSIHQASTIASQKYGVSASQLERTLKSKNITLIPKNKTRKHGIIQGVTTIPDREVPPRTSYGGKCMNGN